MTTLFVTVKQLKRLFASGKYAKENQSNLPDVKIEFEDCPFYICCCIREGKECYKMHYRTVPDNLSKEKELSVSAGTVSAAMAAPLDFIEGKLLVPGISREKEEMQFRLAAVAWRYLAPYVDWLAPENPLPENSGIRILDESPGAMIVSGEDRPELKCLTVSPKTGKVEPITVRYYADEMASHSPDSIAEGDIVSVTKTVTDSESGETKSIPISGGEAEIALASAKFIEQVQAFEKSVRRRIQLTETGFERPIGEVYQDSSVVKIFLTAETLAALPEAHFSAKKIPEELLPETLIDIIDVPLAGIVRVNPARNRTDVAVYQRLIIPTLSLQTDAVSCCCESGVEYLSKGDYQIPESGSERKTGLYLIDAYKKIAGLLLSVDFFEKHHVKNRPSAAIGIDTEGSRFGISVVTGEELPPLACRFQDKMLFAPLYNQKSSDSEENDRVTEFYSEENASADALETEHSETENVTVEQLKQRAEKGDREAMKFLGKMYETGNGIPKDEEKALELYERALEGPPEDEDLKFDIFMLKMLLKKK